MKYAIFGDIHGEELKDLERALDFENPDVLICTGDFDRAKTIRQFMALEERYMENGKSVIKVPGNHDHAILNNLPITSGALRRQGKSSYELHRELMEDSEARDYIDKLVNPEGFYTNNRVRTYLDKERFGSEYRTIIIHGAYDGDLSSFPACPEDIKDLWLRLKTKEDYRKNFEAMDRKGYRVMVRGHDHDPLYVYDDPDKGIVAYAPENGSAYRLFGHRKHTINPGALFDGFFATIDTQIPGEKCPVLRYHTL